MSGYKTRKENYGIVKRKIFRDYLINTLYGIDVYLKQCTACYETMPITNFYLDGKSDDSVRGQCCKCWDKYNGRSPRKQNESIGNTLEAFF